MIATERFLTVSLAGVVGLLGVNVALALFGPQFLDALNGSVAALLAWLRALGLM
jgi:hypothetical protein